MYPGNFFIRVALVFALAIHIGPAARAAESDVVVGQIGPFSVYAAPDAQEVNVGIQALFSKVNAAGGVHGRRLSLVALDDKFNVQEFEQQFNRLMQLHPAAIILPIGSATLQHMLDAKLLDKHDVVVMGAIPGLSSFRKPGHPHLFHLRAGDQQQVDKIVANVQAMGIVRMHVLYQPIPVGIANLAAAGAATKATGGQVEMVALSAQDTDVELTIAAKKIASASPQSVLVLGTSRFMADALHALRVAGVHQFVFAMSYLSPAMAVKVAGVEGARGLGIAQTFPSPTGVNLPLQREFRAAMGTYAPNVQTPTQFHMEGYVTAKVLVEGLKRAAPDSSATALAKALRERGRMDLGGFRVDFSSGNEGGTWVDIGVMGSSGLLRY